ncbi:M20/M25/M40 family metallo-hydrolase [Sedimentibacter sp.]|uniref:M20/M25/M40 family metallo-hydrolase n=1 Tax=Sedimentibacter sp. TaxID=1960295 RepID=UPI000EE80D56|nr:M20/M25/M40 family metallo-hydrolase [Sedimentibacter sp.]HCX61639.1 hypothetical protein [Clostridiales bacterium]
MSEIKEKILSILKETVSIDSFSATENENRVSEYLYDYMKSMKYFEDNPNLFGNFKIEDDYLGRRISYGMVRGKSNKTVVLMNHHDVVGIDDYGSIKDYAFDIERLPEKIKEININAEALEDLNSGEWIFGRGAADMKGGLAIQLAYLERYSETEKKEGNILFISVSDEESYSAGMRGAVKLLGRLKKEFNLEYSFLIDCEPNFKVNGKHVVSLGTAGKCMPVILAQGQKSHICRCFDGLNPIGVLGEIFSRTELSLEFSDELDGEITVPPTWNYFKDMKVEYDVSIPIRACGYFSVISFYTSPDEILEKLKRISNDSFKAYVNKMKMIYSEYKCRNMHCSEREIEFKPEVLSFEELMNIASEKDKEGFGRFYEKLYDEISEKIVKNEINYPQATIRIMDEVLNFTGISYPVIVLGFAPPYYPALNSRKISGKGHIIDECYNLIRDYSHDNFNYDLSYENYTVGLSDCSYCAVDRAFDYDSFSLNTPMWGKLYSIDFEGIEKLNIPSIIFGPWSKDYHQATERVNRESLTVIVPKLIDEIVNYIFKNK